MPATPIDALSALQADGVTKAKLAMAWAEVIERVQAQTLSQQIKNSNYDGIPVRYGTIHVPRLQMSVLKTYGTARAAQAGDKIKNGGVDIKIDKDREIVEEIEYKDMNMLGIVDVLSKRQNDHVLSIQSELESAYFLELQTVAQTIDVSLGATTQDKVALLIQSLEKVQNQYVNKVPRTMMIMTLAPKWYDDLKKYIVTLQNPSGQTVAYYNGVEVAMAVFQGVDAVIQARGSITQPLVWTEYFLERIPLSMANATEAFITYGTKAVTPDLCMKAAFDADISA